MISGYDRSFIGFNYGEMIEEMTKMKEPLVGILLAIYVFALSHSLSNALISIGLGLCVTYIIYDCYKERSLEGFHLKNGLVIAWGVFLTTLLISCLAINDSESYRVLKEMVGWSVIPLIVSSYIAKNKVAIDYSARGIVLALLILGAASVYMFSQTGQRTSISYGHPNTFAGVLVLLLPIVCSYAFQVYKEHANKVWLWLSILSGILGFLALVFTGSRGGLLGLAGGLLFILMAQSIIKKHNIKKIVAVLSVVIIAGIGAMNLNTGGIAYNQRTSGDLTRIHMWQSSINMWNDHKVFGVGIANWREQYLNNYILPDEHYDVVNQPHDIYLNFLSTSGMVGFMGLLVWTIGSVCVLYKWYKQSDNWLCMGVLWSIVGIYLVGFVDAGFYMKSIGRIMFCLLGIAMGYHYSSIKNSLW